MHSESPELEWSAVTTARLPQAPITMTDEAFLKLVILQAVKSIGNPYAEPPCHALITTFKSLKHYYGIDPDTESHCFQALLLFSADVKVPYSIRIQRLSNYLKVSKKSGSQSDSKRLMGNSIALDEKRLVPVTRHPDFEGKSLNKGNTPGSLRFIKKSPPTKAWSSKEDIQGNYDEGRDLSVTLNNFDGNNVLSNKLRALSRNNTSLLNSSANSQQIKSLPSTPQSLEKGKTDNTNAFTTPSRRNTSDVDRGDDRLTVSALNTDNSPHTLHLDTPSLSPIEPQSSRSKVRFSSLNRNFENMSGTRTGDYTKSTPGSLSRKFSKKQSSIPEIRAAKHWEDIRYRKAFNQFRLYCQRRMGNLLFDPIMAESKFSPSRVVKRKGTNSFSIEFSDSSHDREHGDILEKSPTISRMQRLRMSYGLTSGYNPRYNSDMISQSRLDPIPTASSMKTLVIFQKYFISIDHPLHSSGKRHPSPVLLSHLDSLQSDMYQRVTGQEKWLRERVYAFVAMHTLDLCFRLWHSQIALMNQAKSHFNRYCLIRGFDVFQSFSLARGMPRLGLGGTSKLDHKLKAVRAKACLKQWKKIYNRSCMFLSNKNIANEKFKRNRFNFFFSRWKKVHGCNKAGLDSDMVYAVDMTFLLACFTRLRNRTILFKKSAFLKEKYNNIAIERAFYIWLRISPVTSRQRGVEEATIRRYSETMSTLSLDDNTPSMYSSSNVKSPSSLLTTSPDRNERQAFRKSNSQGYVSALNSPSKINVRRATWTNDSYMKSTTISSLKNLTPTVMNDASPIARNSKRTSFNLKTTNKDTASAEDSGVEEKSPVNTTGVLISSVNSRRRSTTRGSQLNLAEEMISTGREFDEPAVKNESPNGILRRNSSTNITNNESAKDSAISNASGMTLFPSCTEQKERNPSISHDMSEVSSVQHHSNNTTVCIDVKNNSAVDISRFSSCESPDGAKSSLDRKRSLSMEDLDSCSSISSVGTPQSVHALGRRHSIVLKQHVNQLLSPDEREETQVYNGKKYIKAIITSWYRSSCISDTDRLNVHFTKWKTFSTRAVNLQSSICAIGDLRFKVSQFQKFKESIYKSLAMNDAYILAYSIRNRRLFDGNDPNFEENTKYSVDNWSIAGFTRLILRWKRFVSEQFYMYDLVSRKPSTHKFFGVPDKSGTFICGNSGISEAVQYKINITGGGDGCFSKKINVKLYSGMNIFKKRSNRLSVALKSGRRALWSWNVKYAKSCIKILQYNAFLRRMYKEIVMHRIRKMFFHWKVKKVEQCQLVNNLFRSFHIWSVLSRVRRVFATWFSSKAIPLLRRGFRKMRNYQIHCEECFSNVQVTQHRQIIKSCFNYMRIMGMASVWSSKKALRRAYMGAFIRPMKSRKFERTASCRRQLARWVKKYSSSRERHNDTDQAYAFHDKMCIRRGYDKFMTYCYERNIQTASYLKAKSACRLIYLLRGIQLWQFYLDHRNYIRTLNQDNCYAAMSFWKISRRFRIFRVQRSLIGIADKFLVEYMGRKYLKIWYRRTKKEQLAKDKMRLSKSFRRLKKLSFAFTLLSSISH